jgi:hypothetical protein
MEDVRLEVTEKMTVLKEIDISQVFKTPET